MGMFFNMISGGSTMKKCFLFICVMLLLCGCSVIKKPLSDEEILEQIRITNTEEKLKEAHSSIYFKDTRSDPVLSYFDDKQTSLLSYFDKNDAIDRVDLYQKDFLYSLNEDSSLSQFAVMEKREDIFSKLSRFYSKMDLRSLEKTDAFYIVSARIGEEANEFYDRDKEIASVDLNLLVDKTYTIVSFQEETISYKDGSEELLPEAEIVFDLKEKDSDQSKMLKEFFRNNNDFRRCTIVVDPESGERSSVEYSIAKGVKSGVVLPDGYWVDERSSVFDNDTLDNDVTYLLTDREETMKEKQTGTLSKDGVYTGDPSGFVSINEYIPDVILEIRYATTYNFTGDRVDGYEEPVALLSKEAAAALKKASDTFVKRGYRIKVYDAYRPQKAVDHFVNWGMDVRDTRMKEVFYPELDKADVFEKGFVARTSSHTRGSTVDLTLVDAQTGMNVDMGSVFDMFSAVSNYETEGLSEEQKQMRKFLRDVMIESGFDPYAEEWWHFTLKDEPYPNTYFEFPVSLDVFE